MRILPSLNCYFVIWSVKGINYTPFIPHGKAKQIKANQIKLLVICRLILFTDWAHKAHSVPFEQSKNAHYAPSL